MVRLDMKIIVPTKFGQRVFACGSHEKFGHWKEYHALELHTTAETYPSWSVSVDLDASSASHPLEYKYMVVTDDDVDGPMGVSLEWEQLQFNRSLDSMEGDTIQVNDGMFGDEFSTSRQGRVLVKRRSPAVASKSANSSKGGGSLSQHPALSRILSQIGREPQSQIDKLFMVTYSLPVTAIRKADGSFDFTFNDTPLNRQLQTLASARSGETLWIGLLSGCDVQVGERALVQSELLKMNCIPVFVDKSTADNHYAYCKLVLWPCLHSVPADHFDRHQRKPELWAAYSAVNQAFAEEILCARTEHSLIWVHGYQLLEVAYHVRSALDDAVIGPADDEDERPLVRIGLTMHVPFPASGSLRKLVACKHLLKGMLSYSLLGFLLFDHARHFLSACRRVMQMDYSHLPGGTLCVNNRGHLVSVRVSHVTVEPGYVTSILPGFHMQNGNSGKNATGRRSRVVPPGGAAKAQYGGAGAGWGVTVPETYESPEEVQSFQKMVLSQISDGPGGKERCKVLLGIDVLDYLTGVPQKMLAFRQMLRDYVCWRGNVVLVQISMARRGALWSEALQTHQAQIDTLVKQINTEFGSGTYTPVVHIIYSPTLPSRRLLYNLADVLLLTPIRDGLNVIPYEFVCCHTEASTAGVIVLSEFTGVSRSLAGVLRVNPFKTEDVAAALDTALNMDSAVIGAKLAKDRSHIHAHSVGKWAESFVGDLDDVSAMANASYSTLSTDLASRRLDQFHNLTKLIISWYGLKRPAQAEAPPGLPTESPLIMTTTNMQAVSTSSALAQPPAQQEPSQPGDFWTPPLGPGHPPRRNTSSLSIGSTGLGSVADSEGSTASNLNRAAIAAFGKVQEALERDEFERQRVSRLIVIDYEGVLCAPLSMASTTDAPPTHVMNLLNRLCSDRRNTVWLFSGEGRQRLETSFDTAPNGLAWSGRGLGLCAEGGFFHRRPEGEQTTHEDRASGRRRWERLDDTVDLAWKEIARPILQRYAEHLDNSSLWERQTCFVLNLRDVDPHLRGLQMKEVVRHLRDTLAHHAVSIVDTDLTVEVSTKACGRIEVMRRIMNPPGSDEPGGRYSMTLCIRGESNPPVTHDSNMVAPTCVPGAGATGMATFDCVVGAGAAAANAVPSAAGTHFLLKRRPQAIEILKRLASESKA